MVFDKKTRAIYDLARATENASLREQKSVDKNTNAIEQVHNALSQLPQNISDNFPKYSEREFRELRKEIETLRESANISKMLGSHAQILFMADPINPGSYTLTIHLGDAANLAEIKDVRFSDTAVRIDIQPNIEHMHNSDNFSHGTRI